MGFELKSWPIAWRLGAALCLTALMSLLLERTHLYATSLVVCIVVVWLSSDLLRRFDRPYVAALPKKSSVSFPSDYLQALLDTVPTALIVLREENKAVLVNRAAQRLSKGEVSRLSDFQVLGRSGALRIAALMPGQSELLRLADGRHVLVSVGQFNTQQSRQRLVSLQLVSGSLDAVEIKAWRDMLRVLRHEILNSLTPIVSLTESLAAEPDADDARTSLDAVVRRSRGLMEFVDRYRAVIEPLKVRPCPVNGELLLDGIEALLTADCERARVSPSFQVELRNPIFQADATLLEQALINMIRNAMQAVGDAAAPQIAVRLTELNEEICFSVADNGGGVALEIREQIFVPFFSTKATGSGIGLPVARNIALAHGGRVSYRPNVPVGSVFELFIGRIGSTVPPIELG